MSGGIGIRVLLVFIVAVSHVTDGSIDVYFQLTAFSIPGGATLDGGDCDAGVKTDICDIIFTICLDEEFGSNEHDNCTYGSVSITAPEDTNIATEFINPPTGSIIGISFNSTFPASFKLKLEGFDIDDGRQNEAVIRTTKTQIFYLDAIAVVDFFPRPLRATFDVGFSCSQDYFGNGCNTYCVDQNGPTDYYLCDSTNGTKICLSDYFGNVCNTYCVDQNGPTDYYSCDPATGNKICIPGYTGTNCSNIIDCANTPCLNNGICSGSSITHSCSCSSFWTGTYCETNINECLDNDYCNNGTCTDLDGGFNCACVAGYDGLQCQNDVDECSDGNICNSHGACINYIGSYNCSCDSGYSGSHCGTDVDECNGTNICINGFCTNFDGGYNCTCDDGYTGMQCGDDINECSDTSVCNFHGNCTNFDAGYNCSCATGFNGTQCENDINECTDLNICNNNGFCFNLVGSYNCSCLPGYNGNHCENDIDECLVENCNTNGNCSNTFGSFFCSCNVGYSGHLCQTLIAGSSTETTQTSATATFTESTSPPGTDTIPLTATNTFQQGTTTAVQTIAGTVIQATSSSTYMATLTATNTLQPGSTAAVLESSSEISSQITESATYTSQTSSTVGTTTPDSTTEGLPASTSLSIDSGTISISTSTSGSTASFSDISMTDNFMTILASVTSVESSTVMVSVSPTLPASTTRGPALTFVIMFKGKIDDIDREEFEDSLLQLFVNNGDLSSNTVLRSTYQECDGPNGMETSVAIQIENNSVFIIADEIRGIWVNINPEVKAENLAFEEIEGECKLAAPQSSNLALPISVGLTVPLVSLAAIVGGILLFLKYKVSMKVAPDALLENGTMTNSSAPHSHMEETTENESPVRNQRSKNDVDDHSDPGDVTDKKEHETNTEDQITENNTQEQSESGVKEEGENKINTEEQTTANNAQNPDDANARQGDPNRDTTHEATDTNAEVPDDVQDFIDEYIAATF